MNFPVWDTKVDVDLNLNLNHAKHNVREWISAAGECQLNCVQQLLCNTSYFTAELLVLGH